MGLTKVNYNMLQTPMPFSVINGAPISVLDYGADPTGVNDSTTAIQAALDAIPATVTGGTIYFPAGTYRITDNLTTSDKSVSYVGDGVGVTVIECDSVNAGITFNGGNYTPQAEIRQLNMQDMTIRKTYAPVTGESGGTAVSCVWNESGIQAGFDHARFSNISIMPVDSTTYWNVGLELRDTGGVYMNNVNIANWDNRGAIGQNTKAALWINRVVASNTDRFHIVNCYFHRFLNGILMDQSGSNQVGSIEGIYISNTECVACDTGVRSNQGAHTGDYVNGLQFTNGSVDCQSTAFDLWFVASTSITNNFLVKGFNGGTGGNSNIINSGYKMDGVLISGNNIVKFPTVTTTTNGIYTRGGLDVFKLRIASNTFETLDTGILSASPIPASSDNPNFIYATNNQFVNCTTRFDSTVQVNVSTASGIAHVSTGDVVNLPYIMHNTNVVACAQGTNTNVNVLVDEVTDISFKIYHNAPTNPIYVQWIALSQY